MAGSELYPHYHFRYLDPTRGEQVGAYLVTVQSPTRGQEKWVAIKWYIAGLAAYQVVAEMDLTPSEIAHFDERVARLNAPET
ncbi:MAG: hypothetical protein CL610_06135 [Anaerolineaceae bacterium]|nr:hypothetical protein [Anaerolineaceae bacterium]